MYDLSIYIGEWYVYENERGIGHVLVDNMCQDYTIPTLLPTMCMRKQISLIALFLSFGFFLVSCGSSPDSEPKQENSLTQCDTYLAYLECSLEKLETQEEKITARAIIDQVQAVIDSEDTQRAKQVCETALNTLYQDKELAESQGCKL